MTSGSKAHPFYCCFGTKKGAIGMKSSLDLLVHVACQGNDHALQQLFYQFDPLVRRLQSNYRRLSMHEDLLGEMYLAFAALVRQFDPERGIPFTRYIGHMLPLYVHTIVRRECRVSSRFVPLPDLDQGVQARLEQGASAQPSALSHRTPQVSDVVGSVVTRDLLHYLLSDLTPLQAAVFVWRSVEGEAFEQIALRLGNSQASIRFTYFSARRRMQKNWFESFGALN
jgi:RNA polymerase sigma factor (sigma-70 family)